MVSEDDHAEAGTHGDDRDRGWHGPRLLESHGIAVIASAVLYIGITALMVTMATETSPVSCA